VSHEGAVHGRAGVTGIFPANRVDEDVEVYSDESRAEVVAKFCMLRQQQEKESEDPYLSLADFVAPRETGLRDHVGAFAVAVFGAEGEIERFQREHDDYSKIMVQALADRLVEAFAEALHKDIRITLWGYAEDEQLLQEELLKVGPRPVDCRAS
jgi:5-methyltetrahydrofolate--homocysteine methyltransferase